MIIKIVIGKNILSFMSLDAREAQTDKPVMSTNTATPLAEPSRSSPSAL